LCRDARLNGHTYVRCLAMDTLLSDAWQWTHICQMPGNVHNVSDISFTLNTLWQNASHCVGRKFCAHIVSDIRFTVHTVCQIRGFLYTQCVRCQITLYILFQVTNLLQGHCVRYNILVHTLYQIPHSCTHIVSDARSRRELAGLTLSHSWTRLRGDPVAATASLNRLGLEKVNRARNALCRFYMC
jgi:hypothetical protein